jgi:hypothetical protein
VDAADLDAVPGEVGRHGRGPERQRELGYGIRAEQLSKLGTLLEPVGIEALDEQHRVRGGVHDRARLPRREKRQELSTGVMTAVRKSKRFCGSQENSDPPASGPVELT